MEQHSSSPLDLTYRRKYVSMSSFWLQKSPAVLRTRFGIFSYSLFLTEFSVGGEHEFLRFLSMSEIMHVTRKDPEQDSVSSFELL